MRKIKFRGISIVLDEFVYGYLSYDKSKGVDIIDGYTVYRYSISQFTGLYDKDENDKDRKEIYEGDIVELKSNIGKTKYFNKYVIKWSDDECSFILYDDEESEYYGFKNLTKKLIEDKELKVIGNIYENKYRNNGK